MGKPRWLFIHPFQLRLQRGIEVYLWNLAAALAQTNIEVDILTWDGPLTVPGYARHAAIRLHRVPSVRYFQEHFAVPFYLRDLLDRKYDHVFVHFAGYGEGAALHMARLLHPIDFSMVFHFPPSLVPHRFREYEHWKLQRHANRLIAVSQSTACEIADWAQRPCVVVGHGVDTERFRPDPHMRGCVRKQLGVEPGAPVLISVAALEERKGIQFVLHAMPRVLKVRPDARYWIIGDGPYRLRLEEQVLDLHLQSSVSFWGFQQDVAPYLAASDVALQLSRGEASSVSLLEFAAAGLPVITSRYGPFPELVQADWGQMVSERDSAQVSEAILALLLDDASRRNKGLKARDFVTKHHRWDQVANQYQALIETDH